MTKKQFCSRLQRHFSDFDQYRALKVANYLEFAPGEIYVLTHVKTHKNGQEYQKFVALVVGNNSDGYYTRIA